jgi:GntR family transcriptional regulator, transcriptional repressor for pyruvate dehydrogenase complex
VTAYAFDMTTERAVFKKRLSVSDLVDLLEVEILSGRLDINSALPSERQLCLDHGVGRPLVREALQHLAARGLIEIAPGRGSFVRQLTGFGPLEAVQLSRFATARQVVEARIFLESATAGLAAQRATQAQKDVMRALLSRMDTTADPIGRSQLDLAFHLCVARASGNPVLESMLASVAPLMVQLMMHSMGDGRTAEQSHPLHWECLAAIEAGNAAAATSAMARHLGVADQTFGESYDQPIQLSATNHARSLVDDYGSLDALVEAVLV